MNPYTARAVIVYAPRLATRLGERMATKKIGVRKLAELTKVDKGTISAWRRGEKQRVRVETVRKVAAELDTTAEDLLDMPPSQTPVSAGTPEQFELLRRVGALKTTLASLSTPSTDLVEALKEHGQRVASIDRVLPTLSQLAAAADEASDS